MMCARFLFAAVLAGSFAMGLARSEPNSFLNKSAWTHSALMNQARSDSAVMSRFTRHFGMRRDEVLTMLGGLRAGTLNQDGVYLVYNVNDDEEIRARVIFYRKGTKVWEDSNGTPILKMSCANPMVRGTDDQLAVLRPEVSRADALRPVQMVEGEGEAAAEVVSQIIDVQPDPSAQALAAAAIVPGIASSTVAAGAAFNPLVLAPLAGLGFVKTTSKGGDEPAPPPVPEPATILLVGAGLGALAVKKARKTT